MSKVTFSGQWSAQEKSGEAVQIEVTMPNATKETLTTTTNNVAEWTTVKEYGIPGNYSAKAHINADAIYAEATTGSVPFTVPLQPRTGTLNVVVE